MINKAATITIDGIDGVRQELTRTGQIPAQAVRDIAQFIFDRARKEAGKHSKTGAMEQSTYFRKIDQGWEVGHDEQRAPYTRFVHWGTKPHVITPKKRRALRWPANGRFFFAKRVHHPGYKGDPWLIRAVDEVSRSFEAIVANSIKKVAP